MFRKRQYLIATSIVFISFAIFVAFRFYLYNRYFVLYYHEQIQLFRFDGSYFHSYIVQPGGISGYIGSFLTQFYYYPSIGSIIIASVVSAVCLLFYRICLYDSSENNYSLLFIPFIPAVLLMMSFANINFDISANIGLLFMLAGVGCYIALPLKARYFAGPALFTAIYFVAGGNALLFTVMILVFETINSVIARRNDKAIHFKIYRNRFLYILILIIFSVIIPFFAYKFIYTVPLREAYFALTPGNFLFPTVINKVLWLSFPVLYLLFILIAKLINKRNFSFWKLFIPDCLIIAAMTGYGAYSAYDRKAELLNRMTYDLEMNKFNSVINSGKAFPGNNRLAVYLTNIALAESGKMPYAMFGYRQIGTAGLFLDWQLNYSSMWYQSEVYYRLGLISGAEQCAFEAFVSCPKEVNAQVIPRLAITNIIRRDSLTADKYLRYLDNSLFYRNRARQLRENLASAIADSAFQVPNTPAAFRVKEFSMDYQQPDIILLNLLEANPKHRLAFEYLMSYYLLQKDIDKVKWCMDRYYGNFNYPSLPTHYEEALIAYQYSKQTNEDMIPQYHISQATMDRFGQYVQAYKAAQTGESNYRLFEKRFGDTYWFYVHYTDPSLIKKKDEKNRY